MLNTFTHVRIRLQVTAFEIYKNENLTSDPMFYFLVMAAMLLTDQKSKQKLCADYPKEQSYKV